MSWEKLISTSFSKSKNPLVYISKLLSVLGMAVGCFSIVTALSIMNGFEKLIEKSKTKIETEKCHTIIRFC